MRKKTAISLMLFAAAMVGTSVCVAGSPFDGTWESTPGWSKQSGKWIQRSEWTVTFHSDGGKISGTIRELGGNTTSFETRPCGPNGVQWFEGAGGAGVVFCCRLDGDTLTISMIGRDSAGRSFNRSVTTHRVSK